MNISEENKKLITFWNEAFQVVKPRKFTKEDFDLTVDFNRLIKRVGDSCTDVLDIGCGYGFSMIAAKILGNKMTYGLGIDPSENAINMIEASCYMSDLHGLDARVETHEVLKMYDDQSFDGVICSNVLDVIPKETSDEIIVAIKRLLKPGGLLLLKFNFLLTEDMIKTIKMEKIGENTYAINGILRGVNYSTEAWISKFNGFEVIEETSFPRIPDGPKDRVLLLKKAL